MMSSPSRAAEAADSMMERARMGAVWPGISRVTPKREMRCNCRWSGQRRKGDRLTQGGGSGIKVEKRISQLKVERRTNKLRRARGGVEASQNSYAVLN